MLGVNTSKVSYFYTFLSHSKENFQIENDSSEEKSPKDSRPMMVLVFKINTVKPFITSTSEDFIKCRLDNFSMSFILYYVNFSSCENK